LNIAFRLGRYPLKKAISNAIANKLKSPAHFSVNGTPLEACASIKLFKAKDGSDDENDGDFYGQ